jgi:hypothetical protein
MTQDEIIEMARQAKLGFLLESGFMCHQEVKDFAKLVAEKEREACAKEADKRLHDYTMLTSNPPQSGAAWSIASAIRARGQA